MAEPGRLSRLVRTVRSKPGRFVAALTALVVAVPVTLAVLHPGFPQVAADLYARTVWVNNGSINLAGRINQQIHQLTSSVVAGQLVDIAQDGDDVFTLLADGVARVDPAFAQLTGLVALPSGMQIGFGSGRLLLTQPSTGGVWVLDANRPLTFDPKPTLDLGAGGVAAIGPSGLVMGYSPTKGELTLIPADGGDPQVRDIGKLSGDLSMAMVGDRGVVLDAGTATLLFDDGTIRVLDVTPGPVRLQQTGPEADAVLVSSVDALVSVNLASGAQTALAVPGSSATASTQIAAPVRVGPCVYGAWTTSGVVTWQCAGQDQVQKRLPTQAAELRFRVNRNEVVLNDVMLGQVFQLDDTLAQIADWDQVPQTVPQQNDDGSQLNDDESSEDTPPPRSDENTRPEAIDDTFGARPDQTTVLPVLDNDTDKDGDLLVVSAFDQPPAGSGTLQLIDGGRALQFTAAPGATGSFSVQYTASDGRPGGDDSAIATIGVGTAKNVPTRVRNTSIQVEQGQSISYDVLADWIDPDGDEIYLKSATGTSGDTVRYTPDGTISFTSITSELGPKTIDLVVADGPDDPATGTFTVRVVAPGTLPPTAYPDLVTMIAGHPATVSPLANDRNPTGTPLSLSTVTSVGEGVAASVRQGTNEVYLTSTTPGTSYVEYVVSAGAQTATGVIRVDVEEDTGEPAPPIAVRDVAYLRPDQSVDLAVLANDVSPDGLVLGVQSVAVDPDDTSVTVEILKNTLLRVSSSSALAEGAPVRFTYTISDGGPNPASATVVIIPVPALLSHQPPIANDDHVVVRAGDYASVPVLKNDVHPDGSRMSLAGIQQDLPAEDGFAFASGDRVRYQAPLDAGTYTVGYTVIDDFGQQAAAKVVFTVTAVDVAKNQPPAPPILTARVLQGSSVLIELPTVGIDPDGDSAVFQDVASAPRLGIIEQPGAQSFRYRAAADATGTDEFEITLTDAFGATGIGLVRIGVLPTPTSVLPPLAVDDTIAVRPGRQATVAVLANDSDPSGLALSLVGTSVKVDEGGLTAAADDIDSNQIAITVPASLDSGSYYVAYDVKNSAGIVSTGHVIVQVDPDAPLLPPVAFDHVVDPAEVTGRSDVLVDVLSDARNPSGTLAELEVTLAGPGAGFADVTSTGQVDARLGDQRRVIAYTLTNADGLSSTAFVVVPDREAAQRPHLRDDLGTIEIPSGELKNWALGDLVVAPSGGALRLMDAGTSTHAAPDHVVAVGTDHVAYQSADGYTGPASITFEVADGDPEAATTRTAFITVPIIVTGADAAAVLPTFAGGTQDVPVADQATVGLRSRTVYPQTSSLRYEMIGGSTSAIAASIEGGDQLVLKAAPASTGQTTTVTFRISGTGFDPVTASLDVVVVKDPHPLATAVDDELRTQRPQVAHVFPLANDVNPFGASDPLTIVKLEPEENGAQIVGQPTVSSDGEVTVTPAPGFVGNISLIYTVQDRTKDPSREVTGRIRLIYRDVPDNDAVNHQGIASGNKQLTVTLDQAPKDNGEPIDQYQVQANTGTTQTCVMNQACVFAGLTNGTPYSFTARAHNLLGWGQYWSLGSGTPFGPPPPPANIAMSSDYDGVSVTWTADPGDSGGIQTVVWELSDGRTGQRGPGEQPLVLSGSAGQCFTIRMASINPAGQGAWSPSTAQKCIPSRPYASSAGRSTSANFPDATGGESASGARIFVIFSNIQPGTYRFCAATTTSTTGIHWFHWNLSGQSGEVRRGVFQHCGTANIDSSGYVEPFGMALPDNRTASVRFWLEYSDGSRVLSSNPDKVWTF